MASFKLEILTREKKLDPDDDNVDVEVTLDNGQRYSATFFTMQNLNSLFKKNRQTGECKQGLYFWTVDMIIVEKLTQENIRKAIEDIIEEGDLPFALSLLTQ